MNENSRLEAALKYAKKGYPVLPVHSIEEGKCTCRKTDCSNQGKHPYHDIELLPNGVKSSTTDIQRIKEWWRKWPNANVAIATGSKSVIVIDVDLPDGPVNMEKLLKYGELPETTKNLTGGGGYHLLFKHPNIPIINSASKIAQNIDVRGESGYIVVPPSKHKSGTKYKWENSFEDTLPAELPEFLIDYINKGEKYCDAKYFKEQIPEGTRNDKLASIAGTLRYCGDNYDNILECLTKINESCCVPLLPVNELEKISNSVQSYTPNNGKSPETGGTGKGGMITEFINSLIQGVEVFKNDLHGDFVSLKIDARIENYPINSGEFKKYCQSIFYYRYKTPLKKNGIEEVLAVLSAEAQKENIQKELYVRIAHHNGNVYLDLANGKGQVFEITQYEWKECYNPPVKFYRPKGLKPLPVPINCSKKKEGYTRLKSYLPKKRKQLILSWIIGAFNPHGAYPILVIKGTHGAGKSTMMELIKGLIDPASAIRRTSPKNEHDLMIMATSNWVLSFDNLSQIPANLSDAFCRMSTGGGLSTRKQYTDAEEVIFDSKRPMIINGIPDIIKRPDLADRVLMIELSPMKEKGRKTEKEFWEGFEADRPYILGYILNAVSTALKNYDKVKIKEKPRLADFAQWVTAAEEALPFKKPFIDVYREHHRDNLIRMYDDDPVICGIRKLLKKKKKWKGTASDLLDKLNAISSGNGSGLPKTPLKLSHHLTNLATPLNHLGVVMEKERSANSRNIILRKV